MVVGWPAASLACACSVNIVDSLQHVHLIGCGDQRAGVQTVRQNITKLSVTKMLCCHWARAIGYVWHWYNAIFKTIAGVPVLKLPNLSLWANTCDSRLTCITRCLYRAPRVAKLSLVCGMRYVILEIIKRGVFFHSSLTSMNKPRPKPQAPAMT